MQFKNNLKNNKAFSIIEMLVVIAIFGIVTGVVLFQYGQFNSQIVMTNTAYEIATTIQQAQVFALGQRVVQGADNMENRYGVYFNKEETDGEKNFIFFVDYAISSGSGSDFEANGTCDADTTDGSGSCYRCTIDDECIDKFKITRDIFIEKICLSDDSDPIDSDGGCSKDETNAATVTFQRPNPDAIFKNTDTVAGTGAIASMGIVLTNRFGSKSAVVVRNTGQISVITIAD